MKRQSAAGLFGAMFLRATVVILGLVIIVFGVVFISKVVKSDDDAPATTVGDNVLTEADVRDELLYNSTEAATEAAVTEQEQPAATSYDKSILVLNSTDVTGLAGRWCETLNADGYANTEASDYATALENTKIVAREAGIGEDLVSYFNGAAYEVGTVTTGTSVDTSTFDIIIIIGAADSSH